MYMYLKVHKSHHKEVYTVHSKRTKKKKTIRQRKIHLNNSNMTSKSVQSYIAMLFLLILLIVYSQTFVHVSTEFFLKTNYNPPLQNKDSNPTNVKIPKIIHQIFFNLPDGTTSQDFKKKYENYPLSWKKLNPDHTYILWNNSMIRDLLSESYPEILPLFDKYKQEWVTQTDIARYVVVHHMGGVYMDYDVMCKQNLSILYNKMGQKEIALFYTSNPVGISTDFIAGTKHNKFLAHVIEGLNDADVPYLIPYMSAMFKTGPMFFYGRYVNYPYPDELYLIPPEDMEAMMFRNFGRSWHSFDGVAITMVYEHHGLVKIVIVIVFVVLVLLLIKRNGTTFKTIGMGNGQSSRDV